MVREFYGAGFQHGMVAEVGAHRGPPFYATEKVPPVGIRLDNDRHAANIAVVHQKVDFKRQDGTRVARRTAQATGSWRGGR